MSECSTINLSNEDILDLFGFIFNHQTTVKMMHFGTNNYNHHKILDEYYDNYLNNMDLLIECLSSYQKFHLNKLGIEISIPTEEEYVNYFLEIRESFNEIYQKMDENHFDQGLLSTISDMINNLSRTIYLLKFN